MSNNPFGSCHKCGSYANGRGTKECLKCEQLVLFNKTCNEKDEDDNEDEE